MWTDCLSLADAQASVEASVDLRPQSGLAVDLRLEGEVRARFRALHWCMAFFTHPTAHPFFERVLRLFWRLYYRSAPTTDSTL